MTLYLKLHRSAYAGNSYSVMLTGLVVDRLGVETPGSTMTIIIQSNHDSDVWTMFDAALSPAIIQCKLRVKGTTGYRTDNSCLS